MIPGKLPDVLDDAWVNRAGDWEVLASFGGLSRCYYASNPRAAHRIGRYVHDRWGARIKIRRLH